MALRVWGVGMRNAVIFFRNPDANGLEVAEVKPWRRGLRD